MDLQTVLPWVVDNAVAVLISSLVVLGMGMVTGVVLWDRRASIQKYLEHRREVRIQRGIQMGRKKKAEREAHLKGLWSDMITNAGEEFFFKGTMTREEVNAFYRAIGKTHHMPDLLPYLSNSQLKTIIRGRRSRGDGSSAGPAQEKPAWGDPPSATPAVKPANVVDATKRFGDKALKRLKKTG